MSGHSKWKTIQHKKGAADSKRGKLFSRISKELLIAARQGGGKPESNPVLRTVVLKARSMNMPAENIERAIKRGTGELEGVTLEEAVYEGYASGGVGLIVVALTDNKNRAAAEIRHIFNKHGTDFAGQGSVSRGFKRKGQIFVQASTVDENKLMDIILEAGADDMKEDNSQFEILAEPSEFPQVVEALERAGIKTAGSEITLIPNVYVPVTDKAAASVILRFIGELEDNDEVQNVYTNMDLSDAVLRELEKQEA